MRIAYISYLPLADVDFSYLHEAQKIMDITCYIFANPHHINRSVIQFGQLLNTDGIYDSDSFTELRVYDGYLDLTKIKVINVAKSKHWQYHAFRLFNKLVTQWRREYDVVHMTTLFHWYETPLFRMRNKLLLSVHDPLPHSGLSLPSRIVEGVSRWVSFMVLKNMMIFNETQKEEFINHYHLGDKNIIVSRLGAYTCLQPIAPKTTTILDSNYLLFSGRITPYKGLQYLLPAFVSIHERFPDLRLIVAGGGEFCFDVTPYDHLDYIEFRHRFIPDTELIDLIKNCKFMVCPYTDATQSGVIMSAFAFNKPVLATSVGGLPEMVHDKKFGRIVKEKDVESIANGICEMLSDPNTLDIYSENIEKEYGTGVRSWTCIAQKLNDEYKRLLK